MLSSIRVKLWTPIAAPLRSAMLALLAFLQKCKIITVPAKDHFHCTSIADLLPTHCSAATVYCSTGAAVYVAAGVAYCATGAAYVAGAATATKEEEVCTGAAVANVKVRAIGAAV